MAQAMIVMHRAPFTKDAVTSLGWCMPR